MHRVGSQDHAGDSLGDTGLKGSSRKPERDEGEGPAATYLASKAPGSRPALRSGLRSLAVLLGGAGATVEVFAWHTVTYAQIVGARSKLMRRLAPSSVNRALSAFRGVVRASWLAGVMDAEAYRRAIAVESVSGAGLTRGRALDPAEVEKLFNACSGGSVIETRDAALVGLAYGAGLRRRELVELDRHDVDLDRAAVKVRGAKGRRQREVPLPAPIVVLLRRWLSVRGRSGAPLFVAVDRRGGLEPRRLSTPAVYWTMKRRFRGAGIEGASPHCLRRTYITQLLDHDVDPLAVQRLAGHRSLSTTGLYDRRATAADRRAVARLPVPEVE